MLEIKCLPPGWSPLITWQCSQRGDVWTDVVALNAGQAAINQARLWMAMGYRLPMTILVRQRGSQELLRYRVATSEIAATLLESDQEHFEIVRTSQ